MDHQSRIERSLERSLSYATAGGRPPKIAEALRFAVFPGGARVRPRLCLAVAGACGDEAPEAADAAAAALELLHCASLVHDDMPCFDNADLRRGKPTVHKHFGEPLALLTGDALIVLAFETLARDCATTPEHIGPLVSTLARAVGMPHGLVAGQAWESEAQIPFDDYHRAKTASLFMAATTTGAIAGGGSPLAWQALGEALGRAYQIADDLRDALAAVGEMGKPCGQDLLHDRPNAVRQFGVEGAVARLEGAVGEAVEAVPDCEGTEMLQDLLLSEAKRLKPKKLSRDAA